MKSKKKNDIEMFLDRIEKLQAKLLKQATDAIDKANKKNDKYIKLRMTSPKAKKKYEVGKLAQGKIQCAFCGKQFNRFTPLVDHISKDHSEEWKKIEEVLNYSEPIPLNQDHPYFKREDLLDDHPPFLNQLVREIEKNGSGK